MFFRKNYSQKIIFFLLFVCSSIYAQKDFKDFYSNLNEKYPDRQAVNKAKKDYLESYKKEHIKRNLALAKLIGILYIKPEDSIKDLRKSYELIKSSDPDTPEKAEGYFWTAVFLEKSSLDLSRNYLKEAIKINLRNQYYYLLPINYHILGRNYYKRGNYPVALSYFSKALQYFKKQKQIIHISSMYNNFGLTYAKMKNYSAAIKNALLAIKILSQKNNLTFYEKEFLHSIKVNLGNYYYETGDFKNALSCYEEAFSFSKTHPASKGNLYSSIPNMYNLYKSNPSALNTFIKNINGFLDNNSESPLNIIILKVLQKNALEKGNNEAIRNITFKLNQYNDLHKAFILKRQRETTEDLNKYLIASVENEQFIFNQTEKNKKLSLYFILILMASGLFYFYKVNHLNKEKAKIKNDLLENEKKIMLERMEHLNLNLDLKSNTEKEFLSRLKKIKKEKNYDAEEIIKDLHLSISSLLNIDRKHEMEAQKKNILNENFLQKLAQDHPGLASQDLQLCGYIHLSLTNKEIALLQNLTPPSVRVYKTRLKAKLNLSKEQDLEFYLKTKYL